MWALSKQMYKHSILYLGWCVDRSIQLKTGQVNKYIASCLVVMSLPSTFGLKSELVQTRWVYTPVCIW